MRQDPVVAVCKKVLPGEGASGDTLGAAEVALLEKKSSWEKC